MVDARFSTGLQVATLSSFATTMEKGVLYLFGTPRPVLSNNEEGLAQVLVILTLNGDPFTPVTGVNGFNMEIDGNSLVKAIDPVTTVEEVVQGVGLVTGTASWGRWYDKNRVQGSSQVGVRLDGTVSTSTAATFSISTMDIAVGDPVFLKSINLHCLNR